MRAVWKFTGDLIEVPAGAKPVFASLQNDRPAYWFEVPGPNALLDTYETFWIGTGQPVPDGAQHVSSMVDGTFVWHFYVRQVVRP